MSVLDRARAIRQAAQQSQGLRKQAFVPFTAAAQEAAMAPTPAGTAMPPAGTTSQGAPPTGDPSMAAAPQGGMPPMPAEMPAAGAMSGGQATGMQIQMVPGPNGEPIDAETGMIVLDPQQGIEVDPNTGISLNKSTGEFVDPNGQPLPPEQAMQMISQSMQSGVPVETAVPAPASVMPSAGAPVQPSPMQQMAAADQNPADMLGAPAPAPTVSGQVDPGLGMMVDPNTGMPIDPTTGNLIDPSTGQMLSPATGQPAVDTAQQPGEAQDELAELLKDTSRSLETQDKNMHRVTQEVAGMRADIQGLRRQIQQESDDKETLLARVDNLVNIAETVLNSGPRVPALPANDVQLKGE